MDTIKISIESTKGNKTIESNPQHAFDLAGAWLEEMQPSFATVTLHVFGESVEVDDREFQALPPFGSSMVYEADLVVDALARAYKTASQTENQQTCEVLVGAVEKLSGPEWTVAEVCVRIGDIRGEVTAWQDATTGAVSFSDNLDVWASESLHGLDRDTLRAVQHAVRKAVEAA